MTETIKETPIKMAATNTQTIEYIIYFFFGMVETLLAFRLILKLAGASLSSTFVRLIYGSTGIFILPFNGIFSKGYAQGAETTSVFEPSALVAIIVYLILAWGIVKLVRISSGEKQES
jgi:hypothetical protein